MKYYIILLLLIFSFSCSNKNKKTTDEWKHTKWEQLQQENIRLRLPNNFKRSSRYRIKEDIPFLAENPEQLAIIQNRLESLEFKDAEIDVWIDTTYTFRMICIVDTSPIPFGKNEGLMLKNILKTTNQEIEYVQPNIEISPIKATMKTNKQHKLLRYSTSISNKELGNTIYNSIFFLTGESYTLVVTEFSEDEESIEKNLWTAKRG